MQDDFESNPHRTVCPTEQTRERLCLPGEQDCTVGESVRPSGEPSQPSPLIEGEDYYYEGEMIVFTARYHLRRGYCCQSGCRHCPYDEAASHQEEPLSPI
ncbi:MAG: DUF5522 domain-containing protein [Acidobacteriota bacterium]